MSKITSKLTNLDFFYQKCSIDNYGETSLIQKCEA